MKINRHHHAVKSAFARLTAVRVQPSKTSAMKRFVSLLVMLGTLAVGNAIAATYTWDGGNATGNWSLGGAGGNWTGGAAPASSTANALVFQSNSNGQIANNDIGTSFDVDTLTFNVSGITLSGGSIRFNTAAATKMTFGANAVTFNNSLELAVDTTLSTSTANPIIFNGQLVGPGKLNYVNAGTSLGTLFKFASSTANTINGFTLGNATTGKGKATVQIAMDNPFGGAGTTAFLNNSGGVTFIPIGGNRVVASGFSYRDDITFSGSFDLTFQGNGAVNNTTARFIYNNLDSGKTLTLGTSSSTWDLKLTTFSGTGMGILAAVVSDTAAVGFSKSGTGIWRLTGANTYTTQTKVNNGTLEFNSVENKGSTTASALGKPTVDGTKEMIALGNVTTAVTLKYVGTNTLGHSTDRPLNLVGTTGGATVDASGTGPISFLGGVYATGLGNKTLTLQGTNTSNNTIGGAISNSTGFATSLVKDGAGTWLLTGANTYTGTTTVISGKLLLNGSLDASTSVTVTNSILGGTGTLNGNLTVRNSGIIAPGTSVGTLTNNLTGSKTAVFAAGAKFAFELGASGTSDTFAFTGLTGNQVTFNANVIDFSNAGSWGAGTYTLFAFDATSAYAGTLAIGTGLESFDPATHLVYNANNIQLVVVESASKPTVTIAKTTDGAEEGPVNAIFTVTRDTVGIANPVTVAYTVTGTATSGTDYTALSGSVVIGANLTSATITVPVLQDNNFAEGTETVIVTLSTDPTYTVGVPDSATTDITDGNKPVVAIVKTTDGAEAGPVNGIFIVSRTAGETTNYALTVNYTVDGASTATSGSDYTALSGSVTLGVGQTNATIAVPVLQDSDFGEGPETVMLNLTSDSAYNVGTPGSASLDITDGNKPVVTLVKTTNGAEAGPVNGTFTVTRSTDNGTSNPLIVNYTVDGSSTAASGSDYTALTGSATIGVGQTNAIITVSVLQDINFAEGTETVILNLSASAVYTVGTPGSATMDITDGIQPVVSIIKTANGSEVGPVNGSFTINRSSESASSGPVTVYFTTNGSTASAGSDYTALGTTNVTMELGVTNATIQVKVIRDSLIEGVEGVQLNLLANSAYTIGDLGNATVSIEDDILPSVGEKQDFTALYTFSNSVIGSVIDPTTPPYEKGIYFGAFSMVGGSKIGANGVAGQFYATDWDLSDTNQVVNRYFEVTLTPVAKSEMTITNITFEVGRQKDSTTPVGPARWAIRSSLDNFTTNMAVMSISPANSALSVVPTETVMIGAAPATGAMQSGSRLTLDVGYAALTNALTLRIYGWENGGDKDGGIDNVAFSGSWKIPPPRGTIISFM